MTDGKAFGKDDKITGTGTVTPPPGMTVEEMNRLAAEASAARAKEASKQ